MKASDLKIYCDGGARGNPGSAASAFVVIFKGKVVFKQAKYLGLATNNSAEYKAVVMALKWLSSSIFSSSNKIIDLYLDSELVARQLAGRYKTKNENLRSMYYQVKELENKIEGTVIYHSVPRSKNKLSDFLVNKELDKNS